MQNQELQILIDTLEECSDLGPADFDGVARALGFLLPELSTDLQALGHPIGSTDGAVLIVDRAYPDWSIHIRGRANDRDGHWRCTLREGGIRDNDAVLGSGKSPVLAQAILAALMRLTANLKRL
ncbi:hypothetical protein [Ovoidimarina sediminis]|uniref:hypothetical protein n=1 Tax=Ovoidimarina sediminis TaxID=3079856 RepID=UPI00290F85C4|nr:hypothetical protein [Rhodophyticola sp. MJ-SS7]MDU8943590.1 hypothetical protein [Rhodophyticola sp. MJ-SS7]